MTFNVVTILISCSALALSIIVFFREKKRFELQLFTDFTNVATHLFAQKKDFESSNKHFEWAILMLNHLEYLAYLVNHKKLSKEYAILYKPHINSWYEQVVENQLKDYLEPTPKKFKEFKKLYKELNQ